MAPNVKHALLLAGSLLVAAHASLDADAGGDTYPSNMGDLPRQLQEGETAHGGVSPELEVVLELLWALANLAIGVLLLCYVSGRAGCGNGVDYTMAYFHVGARVVEGIAFFIATASLATGGTGSKSLWTIFLTVQVAFHSPFLWAIAKYTRNYDDPKTFLYTLFEFVPLTSVLAVATALAAPSEDGGWQGMIFMVAFEIPLIIIILFSVAYLVAALRTGTTCLEPRLWPMAALLLTTSLLGYMAHWRHVMVMSGLIEETSLKAVVQKAFEGGLILAGTWLTVVLVELKGFNEAGEPGTSAWQPPAKPYQALGRSNRFVVSPERLFSYSFIFYVAAFLIALFSFMYINPQGDISRNKIFHMYKTLHTCVVLDFLPGTIFAQPLFDLQLSIVGAVMLFSFARHILEMHFARILLSATAFTICILMMAAFNLVFALNPDKVSVMAHSVPYMTNMAAQGLFIFSEAWAVHQNRNLAHYPVFGLYVCLMLIIMAFTVFWMTDTLLKNPDIAQHRDHPAALPLNDPIVTLQDRWDAYSGVLTVIGLDALTILWYKVNPRSDRAVGFSVTVTLDGSEQGTLDEAVNETEAKGLEMDVKVRTPLRIAATLTILVCFATEYVNAKVHGHSHDSLTMREELSTLPGAAFFSVGWVFVMFFMAAYVVMACYCEYVMNPNPVFRTATLASGAFLLLAGLGAHGGTIPDVVLWEWYRGPEVFAVAIVLWVFVDLCVLCQTASQIAPTKLVLEVFASIGVVVLFLTKAFVESKMLLYACFGTLVIWSFLDSKRCRIRLTGWELVPVPPEHGFFPPVWCLPSAPKLLQTGP